MCLADPGFDWAVIGWCWRERCVSLGEAASVVPPSQTLASEGDAEAWLWGSALLRVVMGDEWIERVIHQREHYAVLTEQGFARREAP